MRPGGPAANVALVSICGLKGLDIIPVEMYTTGVVIGKFYPLHAGHEYLIRYAAERCTKLHVILCCKKCERPGRSIREKWIREHVATYDNAMALVVDSDTYDDNDSELWARLTEQWVGRPDAVFTSEEYGHEWARHLKCQHVLVDQPRATFPVSGTKVREAPVDHWAYLSPTVREYYSRRVVFVGAESTGKTTISKAVAKRLSLPLVPEYGREYAATKDTPWSTADFVAIAKEQCAQENAAARESPLILCDTDAMTTSVWHKRYLTQMSADVEAIASEQPAPVLYLVCSPDVPFVQDGTRDPEDPDVRAWMHREILDKVEQSNITYIVLTGNERQRIKQAVAAVCDVCNVADRGRPLLGLLTGMVTDFRTFTAMELVYTLLFAAFNVVFSFIDFNSLAHPSDGVSAFQWANSAGLELWKRVFFLMSGIASFTGVLSVVMAAKSKMSTYTWGIINCVTYGLFALAYGYGGAFQLNIMFFLPCQFVGIWCWYGHMDGSEVTARRLSWRGWMIVLFCSAFAWNVLWYEIPPFTRAISNEPYPFSANTAARVLDSGTTALSIVAQVLLMARYVEQWFLWIVVDAMLIAMYAGVVGGSISINVLSMSCFFFINALYGLHLWMKRCN